MVSVFWDVWIVKAVVEGRSSRISRLMAKFIKRMIPCSRIMNMKMKIILNPSWVILSVELETALKMISRTINWEKIEK